MPLTVKPQLFFKESILFLAALAVGIFSSSHYSKTIGATVVEPVSFSWLDIVFAVAFFLVLSLVLFKFKRTAGVFFKFFLGLVVFSGSQVIFGIFLSPLPGLAAAILMVMVFVFFRNVLVHNIGIILGIAGVSTVLGISVTPNAVVFMLIALSFYDIIAVYWTHHMVHMAKGMIESGAIFGFVIPFEFKDFLSHQNQVREKMGEKFMVLGSGDIGLPLIMVSSLAVISLRQSLITAVFAVLGMFLTHLIFINQTQRKPMAALPPIATMTIIGYLISLLW